MAEKYVYLNIADESSDDDNETKTQVESPPEPRNTVAAIIALSVFAIIIGAILAASMAEMDQSRSSLVNSVCSTGVLPRYPRYSCFNHTLHLALNEAKNISLLFKTSVPRSSLESSLFVMRDCVALFDDSVYQLSRSVEMMKVMNDDVVLTKEEMRDMKTWVRAAMTDQETCVNGLEEMSLSTNNVDEVKMKMMERSSELLSNCLSILDNRSYG